MQGSLEMIWGPIFSQKSPRHIQGGKSASLSPVFSQKSPEYIPSYTGSQDSYILLFEPCILSKDFD